MEKYFERHLALKLDRHLGILRAYAEARKNPQKDGSALVSIYRDLSDCQGNLTGFLEGVFLFQGLGYPVLDADEYKRTMEVLGAWFMTSPGAAIAKEEAYIAELREEAK